MSAAVGEVLASPGQVLDTPTRAMMEERFGHAFANVRVHHDGRAADSARRLGARAYTVGRDIAFARGEYAPRTDLGARLLAHELAHVVQGREATASGIEVDGLAPLDDGMLEREADTSAELVMSGRNVPRLSAASLGLRLAPVTSRATAAGAAKQADAELEKELLAALTFAEIGGSEKKTLAGLFKGLSTRQKTLLRGFFAERILPQGFFDLDPDSKLDVSQRLLLAAHMMAKAKVKPAASGEVIPSGDGRRELQQIYSYAGVSPREYRVPRSGEQTTAERDAFVDPFGFRQFGVTEQKQHRYSGQGWYLNTQPGDWLVVSLPGQPQESVMLAGWKLYIKDGTARAMVYRRGPQGLLQTEWVLSGQPVKSTNDVRTIHAIFRVSEPSRSSSELVPFDPEQVLGATSSATIQGLPEDQEKRRKHVEANAAQATTLLDRLALPQPEDKQYRRAIQEGVPPNNEMVAEWELQKVAGLHRALVLRVLMSNLEKVQSRKVDPNALGAALKSRATTLLDAYGLVPWQKKQLAAAIDANSPLGGVTIHHLTRLCAIIQQLSGHAVTGLLDESILADAPSRADAAAGAAYDEVEAQRLFLLAFQAEFGRTLEDASATAARFNAKQRKELMSYFRDRRIPKGLFIDMTEAELEQQKLSLAERVLISGHILVEGNVLGKNPSGEEVWDHPKAPNCGRWALLVWIYAGVHPAGMTPSSNAGTPEGSRSPTGTTVFGRGERRVLDDITIKTSDGKSKRKYELGRDGLPFGRHKAALDAYPGEVTAAVMRALRTGKKAEIPKPPEQRWPELLGILNDIEIGDWLYVYNGNPGAQHSVIFAGWVDKAGSEQRTGRGSLYRRAKIFHQYRNEVAFGVRAGRVGFDHAYPLGSPAATERDDAGVYTVVHVSRANNVVPASSEADVLSFKSDPARMQQVLADIDSKGIDPARLWERLWREASAKVDKHDLIDAQRKVLADVVAANKFVEGQAPTIHNLVTLVAVVQRLAGKSRTGALDEELFGKRESKQKPWFDASDLKYANPAERKLDSVGQGTSFDRFRALETNRIVASSLDTEPAVLVPWVAAKIEALESKPAKGTRPLSAEQKQLLEDHRKPTSTSSALEDLTVLIGLWQFASGGDIKKIDGWVRSLQVMGSGLDKHLKASRLPSSATPASPSSGSSRNPNR